MAYTGEEAREAIANLDRFFAVLERWVAEDTDCVEGTGAGPSPADTKADPSSGPAHYVNLRRS